MQKAKKVSFLGYLLKLKNKWKLKYVMENSELGLDEHFSFKYFPDKCFVKSVSPNG